VYWWNVSAAKRDLSGEPLGSRQLLPYLLAFFVLESVTVEVSFLMSGAESAGLRQWLVSAIFVGLTALGCFYVYRKNGGANGERLLERFLVLGWVTGIRFMACMCLAIALLTTFDLDTLAEASIDIIALLLTAAYYAYLGHQVGALATAGGSSGLKVR